MEEVFSKHWRTKIVSTAKMVILRPIFLCYNLMSSVSVCLVIDDFSTHNPWPRMWYNLENWVYKGGLFKTWLPIYSRFRLLLFGTEIVCTYVWHSRLWLYRRLPKSPVTIQLGIACFPVVFCLSILPDQHASSTWLRRFLQQRNTLNLKIRVCVCVCKNVYSCIQTIHFSWHPKAPATFVTSSILTMYYNWFC